MGLGKSLKSIVSKVVKSASSGTKKVVGKTLKTGAKAVKTAAKPLAKVPGMEGVSKSVSKAADQTSAEGNRGLDKATSATDRIVDAAGNIVSGVSDASVGMAKGGLGGNLDFLQAAARGDVRGMGAGALGTWNSAVGGLTDITKTGATGLGESVGVAGDVSGQDKLNRYGENISREGGNVADVAVPMGAELAANYFTGGAAGAALAAARAAQSGGVGGLMSKDAMLKAGASYAGVDPTLTNAALGARSGGLKGAAYGAAGFDPEQFKQGMSLLQGKGVDTQGLLKAAATYGAGAAGKAYGLDPSELKMLEAGTSVATGGNLKDAAMGVGGEYAGMTPQQMSIAKSVAGGNLQNAAGEYAGLSPDQIQAAKSVAGGDVQGAAMNLGGSAAGLSQQQIQAAKAAASGDMSDAVSMGSSGIQKQLGGNMGFFDNLKNMTSQVQNSAGIADMLKKGVQDPSQIMSMASGVGADQANNLVRGLASNSPLAQHAGKIPGLTGDQVSGALGAAGSAIGNFDPNMSYNADLSRFFPGGENDVGAEAMQGASDQLTQPGMWDRFKGLFSSDGGKRLTPEQMMQYEQDQNLQGYRNAEQEYADSQGPSAWDKIKRETGRIGGQIKGAAGAVADYNQENPELANAAIGTTAAGVAFKQQQDALQNQQRILSEQLDQARKMQTFEQETPELLKEAAKGGKDSIYMQKADQAMREGGQARMSAQGAALERMSRMGRGGGELEALLSGAQEGANITAQGKMSAMSENQRRQLEAQSQLSAIDKFNVNQRRAAQSERVNLEQGLRGTEQAYAGQEGNLRSGLTGKVAETAMGTNQAIANRAMANKQAAEQQQAAQAEKLRLEAVTKANQESAQTSREKIAGVKPAVVNPINSTVRNPANITQTPVKKKPTGAFGASGIPFRPAGQ